MSSVNSRGGLLFFDLRVHGNRCREYTKLRDTKPNREKMEAALNKIEAEIVLGTFDYSKYFPGSKNAEKFADAQPAATISQTKTATPLYKEFVKTWFNENEPLWRRSHIVNPPGKPGDHLV